MNDPSGAGKQPEVDLFKPYEEPGTEQIRLPELRGARKARRSVLAVAKVGRKRGLAKWVFVAAGVAVIAVAVVVVVVVVLTGGGDATEEETPQSTAQAFVDAINGRDLGRVNSLTCNDQDKVDQGKFAATVAGFSQVRVKTVGAPNDGQAILVVTAVVDNQETQARFPLRQRPDRSWCVGKLGDATG